jgi:hypothetical protein
MKIVNFNVDDFFKHYFHIYAVLIIILIFDIFSEQNNKRVFVVLNNINIRYKLISWGCTGLLQHSYIRINSWLKQQHLYIF